MICFVGQRPRPAFLGPAAAFPGELREEPPPKRPLEGGEQGNVADRLPDAREECRFRRMSLPHGTLTSRPKVANASAVFASAPGKTEREMPRSVGSVNLTRLIVTWPMRE